jgi:hypothetical protein
VIAATFLTRGVGVHSGVVMRVYLVGLLTYGRHRSQIGKINPCQATLEAS